MSDKRLPIAAKSPSGMHTPSDFETCSVRLKALADSDRLRIMAVLLEGEQSVSDLADRLAIPIDKASHHLGVLRRSELVTTKRHGKFVIYSIAPDVVLASRGHSGKKLDLGCCQLDLLQTEIEE